MSEIIEQYRAEIRELTRAVENLQRQVKQLNAVDIELKRRIEELDRGLGFLGE